MEGIGACVAGNLWTGGAVKYRILKGPSYSGDTDVYYVSRMVWFGLWVTLDDSRCHSRREVEKWLKLYERSRQRPVVVAETNSMMVRVSDRLGGEK